MSMIVRLEQKAVEPDGTLTGYGSVWNVLDTYGDRVAKGAFKRSLSEWKAKGRMPAFLWQHQPDQVIGRWLEMREDDYGLYVKGQLSDTQLGRDARTLVKDGALTGLSIGFRTRKSSID
jgi:HK97 family phage prohead protease